MHQFWIYIAAVLLLSAGLAVAEPPQDTGKPDKADQGKQDKADQGKQDNADQGKQDKAGHGKQDKGQDADIDLRRGGITREVAREWAVEAGITGQKPLPPGIRKNLARGKPIPPGIAMTRLPDGYLGHLPVHEGHRWEQMGTDLLLVNTATGLVADLLPEVFD